MTPLLKFEITVCLSCFPFAISIIKKFMGESPNGVNSLSQVGNIMPLKFTVEPSYNQMGI